MNPVAFGVALAVACGLTGLAAWSDRAGHRTLGRITTGAALAAWAVVLAPMVAEAVGVQAGAFVALFAPLTAILALILSI